MSTRKNIFTAPKELLDMLVECAYEGLILIDKYGVIKYVNKSFASYNNTTPDKLIGQKSEKFDIDLKLDAVIKNRKTELLSFINTNNR